jgi:hypothetical protein
MEGRSPDIRTKVFIRAKKKAEVRMQRIPLVF